MSRVDLIKRLEANQAKHREAFAAADTAYRARVIEWHAQQAARVKTGGEVVRSMSLPVPEDHSDDYAAMIAMLNWAVGPTVDMDEQTFRQLVLDEWVWTDRFRVTSSAYAVS
jgi:hypothetical protein